MPEEPEEPARPANPAKPEDPVDPVININGGEPVEKKGTKVWEILTLKKYESAMARTDRPMIIDWSATWCPPCLKIAPIYKEMAESGDYPGVTFFKIDIDTNKKAKKAANINAMPTFQFFKNGEKVHEIIGGDEWGLKEWAAKLAAK